MDAVLDYMRLGMSMTQACAKADTTRSMVRNRRRRSGELDTEIRSLIAKNDRGPTHIALNSERGPQVSGAEDYWARWRAAASKGVLVKEFGVNQIEGRSRTPEAGKALPLIYKETWRDYPDD